MAFLTYKFLANGTIDGVITVDSTQYFRANQLVTLFADNQPTLSLEVKKIISNMQLAVGPITLLETDDVRSDLSAYTVITNAAIFKYRTGNYVADLSAYTIFNSGDEPLLNGKYIQFKVDFTSNGFDTPIFSWLQTAYKIYSLQSVRP